MKLLGALVVTTASIFSVFASNDMEMRMRLHLASLNQLVLKVKMAFSIISEDEYENKMLEALKVDPRYVSGPTGLTLNLQDFKDSYMLTDGEEKQWIGKTRVFWSGGGDADGARPNVENFEATEDELNSLDHQCIELRKMMALSRSLVWEDNGYENKDMIKLIKTFVSILIRKVLPRTYTRENAGIKDLVRRLESLSSVCRTPSPRHPTREEISEEFYADKRYPINNMVVMLAMLNEKDFYPVHSVRLIRAIVLEAYEYIRAGVEVLLLKADSFGFACENLKLLAKQEDLPKFNKHMEVMFSDGSMTLASDNNYYFYIVLEKFISSFMPSSFSDAFKELKVQEDISRMTALSRSFRLSSSREFYKYVHPKIILRALRADGSEGILSATREAYFDLLLAELFHLFNARFFRLEQSFGLGSCSIS